MAGAKFAPNVVRAFINHIALSDDLIAQVPAYAEVDSDHRETSDGESNISKNQLAGPIADARALGFLVELAGLTRHMTDL